MPFKRNLSANPIIVKELRSRMRGARAFAILTGVLLLLGAISFLLYRFILATLQYATAPLSPQIGQTLFFGLALLELMMVCFITPAITAGAISGERERQTYEMLLATPLSPARILWGKLISGLSYVFLLIFAAVPLASLVFIFGGVTPGDLLRALLVLVVVTIMLGVMGIFASAWLGRTAQATLFSYLLVLALLVGPVALFILIGVLQRAEPPRWILAPNPVSALFSALTPTALTSGPLSFFGQLGLLLSGDLRTLTGGQPVVGAIRPLYHYSLVLYGAITLLLYLLAMRLVQPTGRWRIGWRRALAAAALLLLLGGAVTLAFGLTAGRYQHPDPFLSPLAPFPVAVERAMPMAVPPMLAPTPAPIPTPVEILSDESQAAIYATVLRQLYTEDLASWQQFADPPTIFLGYVIDSSLETPGVPQLASGELPAAMRTAIASELADLPAQFLWLDPRQHGPNTGQPEVADRGTAIITLGAIHRQDDGTAAVSLHLNAAEIAFPNRTFVLQAADDAWQIIQGGAAP